jgi:parvulin-like peptidyl-prolyl isomerase
MDHAVVAVLGENFDAAAKKAPALAPAKTPRRLLTLIPACGLAFLLGAGGAALWGQRTANAPVATVNGETIYANAFNHRMEVAVGANVLQQMIEEKLQAKLAVKLDVMPSEANVEDKYRLQSALPGFAESLKKTRQTPDDVKAGIRSALTSQALVSKGVTVTDEEARSFYAANTNPRNPQARYYRPETVRVAVILSDKPDDIKNALHDLASGAAFTQVAAHYSKDQSKADGGLLPPIRRGSTDAKKFPGLEAALMGMRPGQQIDTFKTANALWIIRCVEHGAEEKVPYDKVKEECRQGALLTKGAQANGQSLQAQLQAFHRDAKIDIVRAEYKEALGAK